MLAERAVMCLALRFFVRAWELFPTSGVFLSVPPTAAVAVFKSKGFQTFAAVPESDAFPVTEADFSHPTLMAVGNRRERPESGSKRMLWQGIKPFHARPQNLSGPA